jgi:hypothetical protein
MSMTTRNRACPDIIRSYAAGVSAKRQHLGHGCDTVGRTELQIVLVVGRRAGEAADDRRIAGSPPARSTTAATNPTAHGAG